METLNTEQQQCKEKILQFIKNPNLRYFGLYGSAGTGKTYTIANTLKEYHKSVLFLGATNKVVNVLKKSLEKNQMFNQNIKTIDSFLKFKIEKDHENNSTITYKYPNIKQIPSLIIIDEVSMITSQKFEIIERLKDFTKLILIGDNMQLPPIESDKNEIVRDENGFLLSKIFTSIPKEQTYTLTIQNRQTAGTPLYDLVLNFRKFMHMKIDPIKLAEKKNNNLDILYYFTNNPELKTEIKNNNCVAVCFKNLTVLNFNWLIGSTKSMQKNYKLNEINVGDSLMFDAYYFHEVSKQKTSFYTSNIVEVLQINENQKETFVVKENIKKIITFTHLKIKDEDGSIKEIRYIKGGLYGENGGGLSSSVYGQRKTYQKHILENKNADENKKYLKSLNTRYANFQNSFAKLKKPYAITAHKAQGSTYDTVIIPVYDYYALNYKDANQLLYVALSRAKNKVIFVNKKDQFTETDKRKQFSEFEKMSICSNYDYKCANKYCKIDLTEREYNIDHITPLASGGKNIVENLQPLCIKCHKHKSNNEKTMKIYGK